jgi:hypothetical protein
VRPIALALALAALFPAIVAAKPSPEQVDMICGTRSTCEVFETHDAGRSPAGVALTVAEIYLDLADKSPDGPEEGCRDSPGGIEYWLLEGEAPPRRILKLCNDGYGASGIGEDDVKIEPNRLRHGQVGGSAWRWTADVSLSLSPLRRIASADCSFNVLIPRTMGARETDYAAMRSRTVADDPVAVEKAEITGCPDWPTDDGFKARPGPGLLAAYAIFENVARAPTPAPSPLPSGVTIDGCFPGVTTAGANGFMVAGQPAPATEAAELRAFAETSRSLLVQIADPLAAPPTRADNWIDRPHVEIWTAVAASPESPRPLAERVVQTIVELDGTVHAGGGDRSPLPSVERWEARDAAGRPTTVLRVTWPDDAFQQGLAIGYSQATNGKQGRVVATTGLENGRPLLLPPTFYATVGGAWFGDGPPPLSCTLHDGRLVKQ